MASYSVYDIDKIRNPELRAILENIMDVTAGHDHDNTNSKGVSVSAIADDAITTAKILNANVTLPKLSAGVQASLALADSAIQADDVRIAPGTPTNAKAASGTLTILGVVKDGETVQIGDDVYEFCSDAAQSLTAGSDFAVDIEAHTTKGTDNLTVAVNPVLGDTFTIGTKVYTIVPAASANGEGDVPLGIDAAATQASIVAAINGSDGWNSPNDKASAGAFNANVSAITALAGGTQNIPTTSTFTNGENLFSAAALAGGADCLAPAAVTALVAAITASDTQGVGAADGANDTVVCTADDLGVAGNDIDSVAVMANGSFAAAKLSGGQAGTVGDQWQTYADASYLYVAVAANTATGANWRRIGLGTAY
jgi:hypothetical protein